MKFVEGGGGCGVEVVVGVELVGVSGRSGVVEVEVRDGEVEVEVAARGSGEGSGLMGEVGAGVGRVVGER